MLFGPPTPQELADWTNRHIIVNDEQWVNNLTLFGDSPLTDDSLRPRMRYSLCVTCDMPRIYEPGNREDYRSFGQEQPDWYEPYPPKVSEPGKLPELTGNCEPLGSTLVNP